MGCSAVGPGITLSRCVSLGLWRQANDAALEVLKLCWLHLIRQKRYKQGVKRIGKPLCVYLCSMLTQGHNDGIAIAMLPQLIQALVAAVAFRHICLANGVCLDGVKSYVASADDQHSDSIQLHAQNYLSSPALKSKGWV